MRGTICDRESETLLATRLNPDDPALRAHAAQCSTCRETIEVAGWIRDVAAMPVDAPVLHDPGYMWWKSELARRFDARRQAVEPVHVAERIQAGVILAGIVALFLYARSDIWSGHYWVFGVDLMLVGATVGSVMLLSAATVAAWKLFVSSK